MGLCRSRCRGRSARKHSCLPFGLVRHPRRQYRDASTNIPLHRVKTKLQVQVKRSANSKAASAPDGHHYEGTMDAINQIFQEEGLKGLYAGMTGCLVGVASTNFAYFYWYTIVRGLYFTYRKTPTAPSTAVELSLGALAGALAQLFTIPVAVVTTRQQTTPKNERKGLLATAKDVIDSEDGWTGLWRGLKASLVLAVNPSITYGAYQRLRVLMFPGKANLAPWESFGEFRFTPINSRRPIDLLNLRKLTTSQFLEQCRKPSRQSLPSP